MLLNRQDIWSDSWGILQYFTIYNIHSYVNFGLKPHISIFMIQFFVINHLFWSPFMFVEEMDTVLFSIHP